MTLRFKGLILFVVVLLCFITEPVVGGFANVSTPRQDVLEAAIALAKDNKVDPKLREDAMTFVHDTFAREREQLEATKRALYWNHIASIVVFAIAHVLVILAISAALHEVLSARRLRKKGSKAEQTEMQIDLEKIAIKTSSMALFYLLLALAFYFMYVHFVYPVTEVHETRAIVGSSR